MSVSTQAYIPTPESSTGGATNTSAAPGYGYACLICRQRKVRCNQQHPCDNCTKAGKECSFIAPVRGKRKRTKPPREGLHAKLKRYEELLRSCGVPLEKSPDDDDDGDDDGSESDLDTHSISQQGRRDPKSYDTGSSVVRSPDPYGLCDTEPLFIAEGGATRYLESDVWGRLGQQRFRRPDTRLDHIAQHPESPVDQDSLLAEEQNSLLLEPAAAIPDLARLHPPADALPALREIYMDRVDPLTKILHLPSFSSSLENVIKSPHQMSKGFEAVCFNYYLTTVSTFDDSECTRILGVDKPTAFRQYRLAARQALVNAEFLSSSSLEVLQAFALFLVGVRTAYRDDNIYMLSGVAVRIARKMGLHRDGTAFNLPFFETEMRRRVWWHLAQQDFRLADTLSARASMDLFACDTATPMNLEDTDFGPYTVDAPPKRAGITSVTICRLRLELVNFFRSLSPSASEIRWETLTMSDIPTSRKDELIRQMEDRLEQNYMRYCDPTESLHTLVQIIVRSSIAKMKLFAHNPRDHAKSRTTASQRDRDIVFANASKLLEYATIVPGNEHLWKYRWQLSTTYLWNTMVYMLIEARHRKTGPEVDRMWQLIGRLISNFPQLFEEMGGIIRNTIRRWMLEVWDDYVMAVREARLPEPSVPEYISEMRNSLKALLDNMPQSGSGPADPRQQQPEPQHQQEQEQRQQQQIATKSDFGLGGVAPNLPDPFMNYDFPDILAFEMDPNEWSQWDDLISGTVGLS